MNEHQSENISASKPFQIQPITAPQENQTLVAGGDPLNQFLGQVRGAEAQASNVKRMTASPGRASQTGHYLLALQRQYGNRYVQRLVSKASQDDDKGHVAPAVETAIENARGGGQPMEAATRLQMESAIGADFGGVRIHTDSRAHSLNEAVNAVAFTTGQDVFFRDSKYNPGSREGRRLLAHELTHVVQQNGDAVLPAGSGNVQRMCSECEKERKKSVQSELVIGGSNDPYEQEADRVAEQVVNDTEETDSVRKSSQSQRPPSGPSALDLIPERPFSESRSGQASTTQHSGLEIVRIKEAVISRNGVHRRISLANRPGNWIARKMNWLDSACKAACWAAGGALAVLIASACAAGTVFTLGGVAIPCAVALGVIGAAVGGAGASICSDLCDNAYAAPSNASAQTGGEPTSDNAVATADGTPVPVPEGADENA